VLDEMTNKQTAECGFTELRPKLWVEYNQVRNFIVFHQNAILKRPEIEQLVAFIFVRAWFQGTGAKFLL